MYLTVNNEKIDLRRYELYHSRRFAQTLEIVRALGGGRTVEIGGHPWAMTDRLLKEPLVDLVATVSAEEVSVWPDALPVTQRECEIVSAGRLPRKFTNFSANIERTRLDLGMQVDLVLACEIIEHLTRAPHVMLLNANAWLRPGGRVLITTPNGAHFENPLRVKPRMPAYRASTYNRHNYVFTMEGLVDLIETCGFEIESTQFVSPYPRLGPSRVYPLVGRLPSKYLREKFNQSLHVIAQKVENRDTATRLPKVYVPSPDWELIDHSSTAQVLEEPLD